MAHRDQNVEDPVAAEIDAQLESDTTLEVDEAESETTEEAGIEKGAGAEPALPAELAAIHTDTESAEEASGDLAADEELSETPLAEEAPKKTAKLAEQKSETHKKLTRKEPRSKKYQQAAAQVHGGKLYEPKEALGMVKEISYAKFDAAVELHIKMSAKKAKAGEGDRFRVLVALPHGTGREPKIGVLDEQLIEKIKQKGDTEFDILLASPSLMPKVAQIAKVLGPKGKMPNPKTGTVTDDPETAKKAILSGRVEIRADAGNNIHQSIGRVSWPADKLLENYKALLGSIPVNRLQRVVISVTMGPSLTIDHTA